VPDEHDMMTKPLFKFIPCGLAASRRCYGNIDDNIELLAGCGFTDVRTLRIPLGTVLMDENYVHRHWDGYFSNSNIPAMNHERRAGLSALREGLNTLLDFGIMVHYEWERTMVVAR
jgi:hypothetical protein